MYSAKTTVRTPIIAVELAKELKRTERSVYEGKNDAHEKVKHLFESLIAKIHSGRRNPF